MCQRQIPVEIRKYLELNENATYENMKSRQSSDWKEI